MDLRVVVYNVRGFRDEWRPAAAFLAELQPDVVLVNECGYGPSLRRFAGTLGTKPVSGPLSFLRRTPRNAVLVRPPWRVVAHRLHRFERSSRFHPRGVLIAHIGRSGFRLWALTLHLGLSPAERAGHARELTDLVRSLQGPVVMGGDLNEGPEGRAASWIGERFFDAWVGAGRGGGETFPGADPSARVDYLFTTEELRAVRAEVLGGPEIAGGSDHRPVVVELTVPD